MVVTKQINQVIVNCKLAMKVPTLIANKKIEIAIVALGNLEKGLRAELSRNEHKN